VALFVGLFWAAMTVAALGHVMVFGRDVPFADDWVLVEGVCGEVAPLEWIWRQHNEHRQVVSRLLHLILARMTGFDSRAGMFFNVVALAALSAAMIAAVSRHRGRVLATDVIFPLALLNLGHWWTFLMSSQIYVVLATVLFCGVVLFVCVEGWKRPGWIVAAGICQLLLPLQGANGLTFMPATTALLTIAAISRGREGTAQGMRHFRLIMAFVMGSLFITALHLGGYRATPGGRADIASVAPVAAQYLSLSFGTLSENLWSVTAFVAIGLIVATSVALCIAATRRPEERVRALGFLLCLLAIVTQAVAVGWGRSIHGELPGLRMRFVTMVAPLPLCIYLAWDSLAGPTAGKWVRVGLTGLMLALLPQITWMGLKDGGIRREMMVAFERDLRAGRSPEQLARIHHSRIFPWSEEYMAHALRLLEQSRLGPYRSSGVKAEMTSGSP
jgi:hypothetical protein